MIFQQPNVKNALLNAIIAVYQNLIVQAALIIYKDLMQVLFAIAQMEEIILEAAGAQVK